MNLLIPNLGSTSLKYQILEMPSETALAKGKLERVSSYRDAIAFVLLIIILLVRPSGILGRNVAEKV